MLFDTGIKLFSIPNVKKLYDFIDPQIGHNETTLVSDIAIFVLKRDVKLQLTNEITPRDPQNEAWSKLYTTSLQKVCLAVTGWRMMD